MTAQTAQASAALARTARRVAGGDSVGEVSDGGPYGEMEVSASILRQVKRDASLKKWAIRELQAQGFPLAQAVLAVREATEVPVAVNVTATEHNRPRPHDVSTTPGSVGPQQLSPPAVILVVLFSPVILTVAILVLFAKAIAPFMGLMLKWWLMASWWGIRKGVLLIVAFLGLMVILPFLVMLMPFACAGRNVKR